MNDATILLIASLHELCEKAERALKPNQYALEQRDNLEDLRESVRRARETMQQVIARK